MFGSNISEPAKLHAKKCYPGESCGIVVDNEYIPCENVSPDPKLDFIINPKDQLIIKISQKEIQAVIHSHTNGKNFPSKLDMERQMSMEVPWGIITLHDSETVEELFWFGDQTPIQPFVGRVFRHGVADCYALVRDWFWIEKKIRIPNYARTDQWWLNDEDMLTQLFEEAGFYEIQRPTRIGDAMMGQIMGKVPNHCAVYLGNGLVLHHLSKRLSNREPVDRWMKFIVKTVRHKDMNDA